MMFKYSSFCLMQKQNILAKVFNVGNVLTRRNSRGVNGIKIPERIERGPTDILQALSYIIGQDTTGVPYKFKDDPYLIPYTSKQRKIYALSSEAGRKAAKWVVDTDRDLFQHLVAIPEIEAFKPKMVYDETTDVEEETLLNVINDGQVSDAIIIYDLLNKKQVEISDDTKLSLLELLCFFGEKGAESLEWLEERDFMNHSSQWLNQDLANDLFSSFRSSGNPRAYCAFIQGLIKHRSEQAAWDIYRECLDKNIPLCTDTYNYLIYSTPRVRDKGARWDLATELLATMRDKKLSVDVGTLNAILYTLKIWNAGKKIVQIVCATLSEFRKLGVEPSLGSYHLVLRAFIYNRQPPIVEDILNVIEGKDLEVRHHADLQFFVTAMNACNEHLHDVGLAHRLHSIFLYGNNRNFLTHASSLNLYYMEYLHLMCVEEPIEKVMERYSQCIPSIYLPSIELMEEVIRAVDLSGAIEHLPRLWSDIVTLEFDVRESLVTCFLQCLVRNPPPEGDKLVQLYGDVANHVWQKLENPSPRGPPMRLLGNMLWCLLQLQVRYGDFNVAASIFQKLYKGEGVLSSDPNKEALISYLDLCIEKNDSDKALVCLEYCSQHEVPGVSHLAKDMKSKLELSAEQAAKLATLTASNISQEEEMNRRDNNLFGHSSDADDSSDSDNESTYRKTSVKSEDKNLPT